MKRTAFCLVIFSLLFGVFSARAEENARQLFEQYSAEISRLAHFGRKNGNPPDGYRELAPVIRQVVSLEPSNPEYRLSAIYYNVILALYKDLTVEQQVNIYREFIAEADAFKKDFPQWNKRLYKPDRPNVRISLLLNAFDIASRLDGTPSQSLPMLLDVFADLQARCHEETVSIIGNDMVDKPFADYKDMNTFSRNLLMETCFIIHNKVGFQTCRELEKLLLRRLLLSPDMDCPLLYEKDFSWSHVPFPAIVEDNESLFQEDLAALREALADEEYMALLAKSKHPRLKVKLKMLETLKTIVNAPKPLEVMPDAIVSLYKEAEKITGAPLSQNDASTYFRSLNEIVRWLFNNWLHPNYRSSDLESHCYAKYMEASKNTLTDRDFLCYMMEKGQSPECTEEMFLDELNSRAGDLAKYSSYEWLKGNPYDVAYQIVSSMLFKLDTSRAMETIRALCPLDVQCLVHPPFEELCNSYGDFEGKECLLALEPYERNAVNDCASQEEVYILNWTLFYKFNVKSGQLTILPRMPIAPSLDTLYIPELSIEEEKYCIAFQNNDFAIFNLEKEEWKVFENILPGKIISAVIKNDTLFLLAEEKKRAEATDISLYECSLADMKPCLRMTTANRKSLEGLPKDMALASSKLVRTDNGSLLLMIASKTGYDGVIYEYDTTKQKTSALCKLETSAASVYLDRMPDGRIIGTHKRGFFLLANGKPVNFINRSQNYVDYTAKYNLKTNNVNAPLFISDDDLLVAPERQLLVNLREPENSPAAWLPKSREILVLPERKFGQVNEHAVYIFTLPKNASQETVQAPPAVNASVPDDLKLLRAIYDHRMWLVIPLAVIWLAVTAFMLKKHRKTFFVCLLALPLVIGPIHIFTVYCGWKYRMELRERFAAYSSGSQSYSIDRMPAEIRYEYARNDYHPRYRDIKAMVFGDLLSLPLLFGIGILLWCCQWKTVVAKQPESPTDDKDWQEQRKSTLPPRPAIRLLKTKKPGKSKLGGSPNLPENIPWPVNPKGKELDFLAQIHCADLPKGMGLPETGTLFFFYDTKEQPWGLDAEKDRHYHSVIYWSEEQPEKMRTSRKCSRGKKLNECFLEFSVIQTQAEMAEEEKDTEPCHQMLGFPLWLQNEDMAPGKVLLLQLDTDDATDDCPGWQWGDDGIIYFWISPEDLAGRNFDNVIVILECY